MNKRWYAMRDRVNSKKAKWAAKYPGMYLLVCVQTGRFALGNPSCDTQGGHLDASKAFDRKHGTASMCDENHRNFLGVTL